MDAKLVIKIQLRRNIKATDFEEIRRWQNCPTGFPKGTTTPRLLINKIPPRLNGADEEGATKRRKTRPLPLGQIFAVKRKKEAPAAASGARRLKVGAQTPPSGASRPTSGAGRLAHGDKPLPAGARRPTPGASRQVFVAPPTPIAGRFLPTLCASRSPSPGARRPTFSVTPTPGASRSVASSSPIIGASRPTPVISTPPRKRPFEVGTSTPVSGGSSPTNPWVIPPLITPPSLSPIRRNTEGTQTTRNQQQSTASQTAPKELRDSATQTEVINRSEVISRTTQTKQRGGRGRRGKSRRL